MIHKYLAVAGIAAAILAAPASGEPTAAAKAEIEAAWKAADKTAIRGPAKVPLLDQGSLKIGANQALIPAPEANRVMAAMGNSSDPGRFGLVVGTAANDNWIVDVNWVKEGYVRDGDAKEWEPDAMLDGLKENTEAGNADRTARGFPAMDITGWVAPPAYDAARHRLVWSLALRDRGAPANEPQTINYNTYALGREGYFSLDLITGSDHIAADKQVAHNLLAALEYKSGKRYEDFNDSTDKVAAYGLAGLIGVVAIKKLGLLAVVGVFLLKVWKIALVGAVAGSAAIRRFFKKSSPPDAGA